MNEWGDANSSSVTKGPFCERISHATIKHIIILRKCKMHEVLLSQSANYMRGARKLFYKVKQDLLIRNKKFRFKEH